MITTLRMTVVGLMRQVPYARLPIENRFVLLQANVADKLEQMYLIMALDDDKRDMSDHRSRERGNDGWVNAFRLLMVWLPAP